MRKTWINLLGAEVEDAPWELRGPATRSICHGPVAAALPFVSAGMSILGGISSAGAQSQAGQTAYDNAVARNQMMVQQSQQQMQEAKQHRDAANTEAAMGQRNAIEAVRKGKIMASRAQAVMAGSGAGVDPTLTAGLLAEGDHAGDVALYEGDERARVQRNAGEVAEYQANASRAGGATAIWQGEKAKAAADRAASATIFGSIAKAGIGLASKYGGEFGGGSDAGSPIGADETMAAYNNAPSWFTQPGMGRIF